jgi:hypothetical protein
MEGEMSNDPNYRTKAGREADAGRPISAPPVPMNGGFRRSDQRRDTYEASRAQLMKLRRAVNLN